MRRHLLLKTSFVTRRTPSIASTLLELDRQKQPPTQVRAECVADLPGPYLPLEEFDRASLSCSHDTRQSRFPKRAFLREISALRDRCCQHERRNIDSDDYREQKSPVETLQFDGDMAP